MELKCAFASSRGLLRAPMLLLSWLRLAPIGTCILSLSNARGNDLAALNYSLSI